MDINISKQSGWPRLTIDEMHNIALQRNGVCLSTEYKNAREPLHWGCNNGHFWFACADSIKRGTWCPKCPRNPITRDKFPEIYEFIKDKNVNLSMISRGSITELSLQCPDCLLEFEARACDITKNKATGLCRNKFCIRSSYRKTIFKRGSSFNEQCPEISDYWDYNKNNNKPDVYSAYTEELKYFKCPNLNCGYSWEEMISTLYARYKNSHKICPECSPVFYEQEMRIYTEFSSLGFELNHRYKLSNYEYDIFCSDLNLLIEYDGKHWHSDENKIKSDIKKQNFALENNINFIRIREDGLPKIFEHEIIDQSRKGDSFLKTTKLLTEWMIKHLQLDFNIKNILSNYLKVETFVGQEFYDKIRSSNEPINSIKNLRPDLLELWGEKNILSPANFTVGSNDKAWWKCLAGKKHPEYLQVIKDKTKKNPHGCPYCFGNLVFTEDSLMHTNLFFVCNYWNHQLNENILYLENKKEVLGIFPDKVKTKSDRKIYLNCPSCNSVNLKQLSIIFRKTRQNKIKQNWQCHYCNCKNPIYENSLTF
jgi:hypothetical protein